MSVRKEVIPAQNHKNKTSFGTWLKTILEIIAEVLLLIFKIFLVYLKNLYRLLRPLEPKIVAGKNVLITGSGHGIGRELAILYASEGATVIGWDVNEENNEETMKIIKQRGYPKAYSYCCDVSNRQEVMRIADKVKKEVGFVSILVNNAGVLTAHKILDQTQDEIEKVCNINILAHFWLIQAFLPDMKQNNEGNIVALSSCAGLVGTGNLGPYSASKFAIRGLMEALLEELRNERSNVQLTIIYPFFTDTGMVKNPKIRFDNYLPLLETQNVAKKIMHAQRTGIFQISIPENILFATNLIRLLPIEAALLIKDFIETGINPEF